MNEIQVFSNEKFGQVRTIMQGGEPWFVAADVCRALELDQVSNAVRKLDDDEKTLISIKGITNGVGNPNVTAVSEPGLYTLVLGSRKPEAKAFKRWITHEVIPTIRKTGGYVHNSEVFIQNYLPFADDTTKQLFRLTLDVVDKQNKQIADQQKELAEKSAAIEIMEPKAGYCDMVLQSDKIQPIRTIAQDYGMTATRLNKILKDKGVQFRQGSMWCISYKYAQEGLAQTKTYTYRHKGSSNVATTMHLQWTQKGRLFIYELLKGMGILPIVERGVA